MPDSAVIPATTTFRMTSLAWALAVQRATETLRTDSTADAPDARPDSHPGDEASFLAGLDGRTRAGIEGELTAAGITDDAGILQPQWLQALQLSAVAPIQADLVCRSGDSSTHCRVNLFDGRGLGVEFTRPVATAADGSVAPAGVADVVTVTLFPETVLWPVMARSLRRFPELLAGDGGGPPGGADAVDPAEPAEPADAAEPVRATVHLDVRSRAAGTDRQYRAGGVWALSDQLYSVRTAGPATAQRPVMAAVDGGDIARQLVWHVLGVQEFLANSAREASAS
ncbi:hypothetical protein [Pseudarthrobacter sp. 1C304]|uniref:hypothetical protein n=1 Tax=Pseudarthrobacter sp. 1C304 TaxID=3457438 RepID=UPI003FD50354